MRARGGSNDSHEALEQLCQLYWYPVFTFARCSGRSREEAEDLTQGFFAHLLEQKGLQNISRIGGKFRSFLLVAFKNFAANQTARQMTKKRGGSEKHVTLDAVEFAEVIDQSLKKTATPDRQFDRAWALLVINRAQSDLRDDYLQAGKQRTFDKLVQFLPGELSEESQSEAATALGMKGGAFRMELLRFKQKFAEKIRRNVAETVGTEEDIDGEVKTLMEAFDR